VLAQAPAACLLLAAVGTLTAVGAGLVSATRPTVKVALAWSTCAQMGFLLVECAVGAWPLALMHLVGHSVYKAHAFLGAGETVAAWTRRPAALPAAALLGRAGLVAVAYAAVHVLVGPGTPHALTNAGWTLLAAGLGLSAALRFALTRRPDGRLARTLLPLLAAGLHLDERVSALALRLWPPPAARPLTPRPAEVLP
jgi:NADH:ubiquinone oxidoreductase subunit 5 (subunit L)/multisubunit Na+/H+ antiporter MnhA subunit